MLSKQIVHLMSAEELGITYQEKKARLKEKAHRTCRDAANWLSETEGGFNLLKELHLKPI